MDSRPSREWDALVAALLVVHSWERYTAESEADAILAALAASESPSDPPDLTANVTLAYVLRAERGLLNAMVTWPTGANGVLAISAYENLVRRLHGWLVKDAARLTDTAPETTE